MKKSYICLTLALCMLLSSCSAVYIDPDKDSENNGGIIEGEYFTDGTLYKKGEVISGFFYEGSWIYVETQRTIGPRGKLVRGDKEYIRYDEVEMKRIVKYNPHTGVVSSPCLDPVCNHSFESGCVMLAPITLLDKDPTFRILALIGDWLLIKTQQSDDEYYTLNKTVFYNLKTGESKQLFEEDLGSEIMTRWVSGGYIDHKFYNIKQILDYSETGYKQGIKGKDVLDFAPKTKQILCEYDLDSGTSRELFEIPENFSIYTISSKRFFFIDDEEVRYSCYYDGSNMAKEEYLDFSPENQVGTYAYLFYEQEGFIMFDLKTNEKKSVSVDYNEYYEVMPCEEGMLFDHVTKYEEYVERGKNVREIINEYKKTMSTNEAHARFTKEQNDIIYSGTSKVYMTDFDGENMRLIYEEENAVIRSWYASGDFLFAQRSVLGEDGKKKTSDCVINMKTGEITELPLLEIVIPDWYVNDPSVFTQ